VRWTSVPARASPPDRGKRNDPLLRIRYGQPPQSPDQNRSQHATHRTRIRNGQSVFLLTGTDEDLSWDHLSEAEVKDLAKVVSGMSKPINIKRTHPCSLRCSSEKLRVGTTIGLLIEWSLVRIQPGEPIKSSTYRKI
jgi:hypothetical protein